MKKIYENPSMLMIDLGAELRTDLDLSENFGGGEVDDLGKQD